MSRALSVHQGKGATASSAMLGAMLEAVESDAAERFDEPGTTARWRDLAPCERVGDLADLARFRDCPPHPDEMIRWTQAERCDGTIVHVPFECVSLDCTIAKTSKFERASAGLATGVGEEDARRAALLELIERDACARFDASDVIARLQCEVFLQEDEYHWFGALVERMNEAGLALRLFVPKSPANVPVVMASVRDPGKEARPYVGTVGHAAHPDPEIALFQAIAEALQSRLTFIAGARDDCWPWDYEQSQLGTISALAPPPAPGIDESRWGDVMPGPATAEALCEALVSIGVSDLAFVPIARPNGFTVLRAFAPGLGTLDKAPRL